VRYGLKFYEENRRMPVFLRTVKQKSLTEKEFC